MTRHRILVIGAPAAGKAWLAARIHALTGMPVYDVASMPPDGPALDGVHEWVVVARDEGRAAAVAPHADLVVLVRTPTPLREARIVLRWISSLGRPGLRGLRKALRETARWDVDELPVLGAALEPYRRRVVKCGSSDDVRAVLECIFGIAPGPGART
ncbi:MAG: hypothetical protein H6825_04940 [Planctomycetes bacterium]|nr:hypothetical protein [Planctomycetota bacterium]